MIFVETTLCGVYELQVEPKQDERGFFARTWCQEEFEAHGLNPRCVQCSVSFNQKKGTLRGMHFQEEPHGEDKLIRCTQGAIYDVVLDLRPESATYKKSIGVTLSSQNHRMIYVPKRCAHGFVTLEDSTEVLYQMSEFYFPHLARGFRWNDPAFQIHWPEEPKVISDRDRDYPDFALTIAR